MNAWYFLCFLSAVSVFIAFANQYLLRLQTTIAITKGAVLMSVLILLLIKYSDNHIAEAFSQAIQSLDFNQLLLKGMLGFLLFAGALEIDLHQLRQQRWEITVLALFSTLASTVLIGYGCYYLLSWLDWPLPLLHCLLFGALISPTDPIAVLAIIKKMKAPARISVQIEGESLFNDGVGLVIFTTLFTLTFLHESPTVASVTSLFLLDAGGGMLFGALLAGIAHWLIGRTDDPSLELLITLSIPTSGYALANVLDISGPLAMVVSGIIIGNITRTSRFTDYSQQTLVHFWHVIDAFLNSLLFLLIGVLIVDLPVSWSAISLGLLMIPLVLIARFISVATPYVVFRKFREYDAHSVKILTWGGLRGGLALAMAASLPRDILPQHGTDYHSLIVVMTYVVVVFSIIVQGSTIAPLIRRSIEAEQASIYS